MPPSPDAASVFQDPDTPSADELYPCVGVCMSDPETGVCLGCGRPPLGSPTQSSRWGSELQADNPGNDEAKA